MLAGTLYDVISVQWPVWREEDRYSRTDQTDLLTNQSTAAGYHQIAGDVTPRKPEVKSYR